MKVLWQLELLGSRPAFSLSLFHFDSHSLPLSISVSLALSRTCTSSRASSGPSFATAVWQAGVSLFLSITSLLSLIPISKPPAAPTHPHLTHPLLPLPPLTAQKRGGGGGFLGLRCRCKEGSFQLMPGGSGGGTGCFSFCPLTSISFPPLHPLFPSQKPFLQSAPLPTHFLFFFPSVPRPRSLSNHSTVNTTPSPPPCSHLPPHTYTLLSFSHSLSRLRSLSSSQQASFFFFPFLYMQSGPVIVVLLTHTAVCLWREGAFTLLCYRASHYTANVRDALGIRQPKVCTQHWISWKTEIMFWIYIYVSWLHRKHSTCWTCLTCSTLI